MLYLKNFSIEDSNENLPINLTTDKNIKKLINKFEKPKKLKKDKTRGNSIVEKYSFLRNLPFTPPKPPKTNGYVEKMGKLLINFHKRYIEVDATVGSLRRFENISGFPLNPMETIPLCEVSSCKKINSWYSSKDYHYFEIIYKYRQVYRVKSLEACEKWIEIISASVIYSKYWLKMLQKNTRVSEFLHAGKEENLTIEWDATNEEQFKNKIQRESLNNKNKNKLNDEESEKNSNTTNETVKSKKSSHGEKKKERRKNPYSQQNSSNNDEEDVKLLEDATLTKGITFASFDILECLGSGTFGKVFKVKLKQTGDIYAMKIINKKYLIRNQQLRYAVTECNVLKLARHPFIITLHYAFQTPDHLYMILDFCPGGDLSYHIVRNLFEEEEAKFFIAELILAIENLHNLDIIYRDLKPENILIDSEGHIRLADFGLAKENVSDNKIAQSFCGSPAYLAPEMVNRRGVGKSADIYGIGAVLYEMISGTPPFYAHDLSTMYKNISSNKLMLHDYFSEELKDLLKVLINFLNYSNY